MLLVIRLCFFIFFAQLIMLPLSQCSSSSIQKEKPSKAIVKQAKPASTKTQGNSGCITGDCEDGKGTYVWENGSRYTGLWKAGRKHGAGKFSWASGDVFEGEFQNDDCHGEGVYVWAINAKYEGRWQNGKKDGKGKYTWPNGQVYEGKFKDGNIIPEKTMK